VIESGQEKSDDPGIGVDQEDRMRRIRSLVKKRDNGYQGLISSLGCQTPHTGK
jgi:hypothetical protein